MKDRNIFPSPIIQDNNMDKSFLTIKDLSQLLDVPKSFIYEHTRKGSNDPIPGAFRFGKHLRFKKDEIDKWIERHRKARG